MEFTSIARRLGLFFSRSDGEPAGGLHHHCVKIGLTSLKSPDDPIGNPWFTMLEIEIIVIMPAIVALFVAVHTKPPVPGASRRSA